MTGMAELTKIVCTLGPANSTPGTAAAICQDTHSGSVCDVSTSAEVSHDALVDLAREETFEAPDDLTFGAAVGRPSHNVVDRWLVVPHADDDRPIEGGVGLAVTAIVLVTDTTEAVSRIFSLRETLRPGDLTAVTSEQQVLAGAFMKSGAAEVLRAITLNYL